MWQATAYVLKDGDAQEVLRDVTRLVSVQGGIRLETFFEESRVLLGRVAEIDFLRHTVTLIPADEPPEGDRGRGARKLTSSPLGPWRASSFLCVRVGGLG